MIYLCLTLCLFLCRLVFFLCVYGGEILGYASVHRTQAIRMWCVSLFVNDNTKAKP